MQGDQRNIQSYSSPPLGVKSLPELFPNQPSKASKMPERVPTVMRSATPTPAIPVTVDSFQNPSASEGHKTAAVTSVVTSTPTISAIANIFQLQAPRGSEGRKATTVTRSATPTPAIPVTVDMVPKLRG